MYKFELFEKPKKGANSSLGLSIYDNTIVLLQAYKNLRKSALYVKLYKEKEDDIVGLKMSEEKTEGAYMVKNNMIFTTFGRSMKHGRYMFIETTMEGIDVFKRVEKELLRKDK